MELKTENQKKLKDSLINRALGLFILFFGIVIIYATIYTDTLVGQLTNLGAGIILTLIGGGMFFTAKSKIKKIKSMDSE